MNKKGNKPKYQLLSSSQEIKRLTKIQLVVSVSFFIMVCAFTFILVSFQVSSMHNKSTGELYYEEMRHDNIVSISKFRAETYSNQYRMGEVIEIDDLLEANRSQIEPFSDNISLKMVCYYTMSNEKATVEFLESFDSKICTHLIVAFAGIHDSAIYLTETQKNIIAILSKHFKSSSLKLLLSVGGYGDHTFETMVYDHANRKIFIKSILEVIKGCGIHGIDLDWEFPSNSPSDKNRQRLHFAQLLMEIRREINRHEEKRRFLLSVCVAAAPTIIDLSYNIPSMNDQVDFINVMCYDYHFYSALTPMTGFNSPLYPCEKDKGIFNTMNINYTLNYLLSLGMDRNKIVVGLPTYGHSFKLVNKNNNVVYAPAKDYGSIGGLGFISHSEVCKFINDPRTVIKFDSQSKCPYAYRELDWISYDNEQSLTAKAEFIKNYDFGGAMIYDLNSDNYKGENCADDSSFFRKSPAFPLTATVKSVLFDDSI